MVLSRTLAAFAVSAFAVNAAAESVHFTKYTTLQNFNLNSTISPVFAAICEGAFCTNHGMALWFNIDDSLDVIYPANQGAFEFKQAISKNLTAGEAKRLRDDDTVCLG